MVQLTQWIQSVFAYSPELAFIHRLQIPIKNRFAVLHYKLELHHSVLPKCGFGGEAVPWTS